MRLLLLSNSTCHGQGYLEHAHDALRDFLGGVRQVLFVPYAGVRMTYHAYAQKTREALPEGVELTSIHTAADARAAVDAAEAVLVGGGNTFHLVSELYTHGVMQHLAGRVQDGLPYVGWSAGANVACPRLSTTNDMPIVEPKSFDALDLVPFQINPHYLDAHAQGHMGETREERILEFLEVNRDVRVVGLREGSMLWQEDERLELVGEQSARVFLYGREPEERGPGDVSFLLKGPVW